MDACSLRWPCREVTMRAALAIRCCTVITPPDDIRDAFSAVSFRAEMGAPALAEPSIGTPGVWPPEVLCTHQAILGTW